MTQHWRRVSPRQGWLLLLGLVLALPARAAEPVTWRLLNGIEATIFPPEYILERMTVQRGDELLLIIDDIYYGLVTSTDDPIIANKGDGSFHPMRLDAVSAALRDIQIDDARLRVRIFVLPFPRREVMDSSARDDVIMLTPGVRPVSEQHVHFTVAHEIGHSYQYQWLPDHDTVLWGQYSDLRDIADAATYHAGAIHKNRPHEIFAEDFRFLFGGALATASGTIENDMLALPEHVDGLEEFLVGLPEARRAAAPLAPRLVPMPNPFNPETVIRVQFAEDPGARNILLRIFDAQGHLVRRLWSGVTGSREVAVRWNGSGDTGKPVASGVYFARVDYAGTTSTAKLLLLE